MAEQLYCIVDATVSQSEPLEGLTNMSFEAALEWVSSNQIVLEEEIGGTTDKYRVCPHMTEISE
jgi:hypothetical protein